MDLETGYGIRPRSWNEIGQIKKFRSALRGVDAVETTAVSAARTGRHLDVKRMRLQERLVEQRKTVKYGRARFIGLTGMRETRGHPSPGTRGPQSPDPYKCVCVCVCVYMYTKGI